MTQLRYIELLTATLIAVALTACGGPTPSAEADMKAIKAVNIAWNKDYNAGDAAAVAALYADDAVLSVPGVPPMRGKEAINAYYLKDVPSARAAGITVADGAASDVGQSIDVAWQWGTYSNTDKTGQVVESGKYLTIFERRGGKWMIVRDMWNSDRPPAAAAPAAAAAAAQ
jgi:uncharacterized protein (TIGR02246 family)